MARPPFNPATRLPRLAALLACVAATLALALLSAGGSPRPTANPPPVPPVPPVPPAPAPPPPAVPVGAWQAGAVPDPCEELYKLGFQFQAAASCSNVKCHGAAGRNPGVNFADNSFLLWNAAAGPGAPADQHRTAFQALRGPLAAQIAAKLAKKQNLGPPAAAAECLACHGVNPPPNLLAAGPVFQEGVTCDGCHGPSGPHVAANGLQGWGNLHTAPGWTAQARQLPHDQVLKATGFYDTKPLIERAERCASCHLAIDPQMVTAGHPQPMFELNWFSVTYNNRHWDDPTDKYFGAQLWAAGQAVALHDAMQQLAQRATTDPNGQDQASVTAAYNQAFAHYSAFAPFAAAAKVNLAPATAALTAVNKTLVGAANRAALAKAATDAAAAVAATYPAVRAWTPDQAPVMAILKGVANDPNLPNLGAFGVEQQRDSIFALYSAYANSAQGQKNPAVIKNLDLIGQKLFPADANGPLPAAKVDKAQYQAGLKDVKAALKL